MSSVCTESAGGGGDAETMLADNLVRGLANSLYFFGPPRRELSLYIKRIPNSKQRLTVTQSTVCLGQHSVKLNLFCTELSQAECCPGQLCVKLNAVRDSSVLS